MRILAAAILLLLTSTPGCTEEQWEIVIGCTGGVTGGGNGYIVSSQGELFKWQSPTPKNSMREHVSQLPRQTIIKWQSRLEHVRFKELRINRAGNMTCSLSLQSDKDEHVVRWPIAGPYPPDEVMHVFNEIKALGEAGSRNE